MRMPGQAGEGGAGRIWRSRPFFVYSPRLRPGARPQSRRSTAWRPNPCAGLWCEISQASCDASTAMSIIVSPGNVAQVSSSMQRTSLPFGGSSGPPGWWGRRGRPRSGLMMPLRPTIPAGFDSTN